MNAEQNPWSNLISIFYDFKKVANMQFKKRFNEIKKEMKTDRGQDSSKKSWQCDC